MFSIQCITIDTFERLFHQPYRSQFGLDRTGFIRVYTQGIDSTKGSNERDAHIIGNVYLEWEKWAELDRQAFCTYYHLPYPSIPHVVFMDWNNPYQVVWIGGTLIPEQYHPTRSLWKPPAHEPPFFLRQKSAYELWETIFIRLVQLIGIYVMFRLLFSYV